MDGQNKQNVCEACGRGEYCGACGMGRRYVGIHLLKWFLGIIIITWVFAIGMKFGEFEAYFEMQAPYGYGEHNMMFYRTSAMPITISAQAMPATAIMGSTGAAGNVTFTASSVPSGSMKAIEVKN